MATKKQAVSGPRVMNIDNWKNEWVQALSSYLDIDSLPVRGTIFATGMGGSGIVGEVLKHITNKNVKFSKLPIREKVDWVIAISYSGNTTETIYSVKQMKKRGAKVIAITSGGKLPEYADFVVKLESGMLPRDGFPYMLSAALAIIGCKKELREAIKAVKSTDLKQARRIVELIHGKTPVIYSSGWMIAAAKRFKQQLNENAKMFAFFSKMPDSFHNDIEPFFWDNKPFTQRGGSDFVPVIIGNGYLAYKTAQFLPNAFHIKAKKTNKVLEVMSSIYLLDYVTFKLAEKRKIDRIGIPGITMGRQVISGLKSFHKKVG